VPAITGKKQNSLSYLPLANREKKRVGMKLAFLIGAIFLACSCPGWTLAQDANPPAGSSASPDANPALKHRPPDHPEAPRAVIAENIDLAVPKGSGLQVILDREIRVQKAGQPIVARLIEPVYSFDKLLLPVGTEVTGRISQIERVPTGRRIFAALDGNFTPSRKITVEFNDLSLPDGKHLPIRTAVAPGSGQVIRFVTAAENQKKKNVKDVVTEKEKQAKEEARRQFRSAMQQVKQPGKLHRLARYAVEQLPVHPQYIDAGTTYVAELGESLEFGSEPLTPQIAASMNSEIPAGTLVHALLSTPLNSAITRNGAEVQAVLARPVVNDGKLILPQGSVLKGSVVQVQPAHHWKHNGQLRFVFRDLVPPNGIASKVEAVVQGVQSGRADNLQLDSEGGAETKTSKTRYLRSGIAVGLAAATHEDETLNRSEGGAGGFRVVGIIIGVTVHSQSLAIAIGALGASRSIYNNFIARGTEVVFAKHTPIEIGVDVRSPAPGPVVQGPVVPAQNASLAAQPLF
jgi:type IV secretory pathway VirB10-like protein